MAKLAVIFALALALVGTTLASDVQGVWTGSFSVDHAGLAKLTPEERQEEMESIEILARLKVRLELRKDGRFIIQLIGLRPTDPRDLKPRGVGNWSKSGTTVRLRHADEAEGADTFTLSKDGKSLTLASSPSKYLKLNLKRG
jgi:hypothetical protein